MSDDDPVASSREDPETIRARYDWSSTSPSVAVVDTIAIAANREPESLTPLYEVIDPDALNAVIAPPSGGVASDLSLTFRFEGYDVTVRRDGTVVARPLD